MSFTMYSDKLQNQLRKNKVLDTLVLFNGNKHLNPFINTIINIDKNKTVFLDQCSNELPDICIDITNFKQNDHILLKNKFKTIISSAFIYIFLPIRKPNQKVIHRSLRIFDMIMFLLDMGGSYVFPNNPQFVNNDELENVKSIIYNYYDYLQLNEDKERNLFILTKIGDKVEFD